MAAQFQQQPLEQPQQQQPQQQQFPALLAPGQTQQLLQQQLLWPQQLQVQQSRRSVVAAGMVTISWEYYTWYRQILSLQRLHHCQPYRATG